MFWVKRENRLKLTVALLIGMVLVAVIVVHTHGADPDAGRTYSGTVIVANAAGQRVQQLPFAFTVSDSGARVEEFRFAAGLPRLCPRSVVTSVGKLGAGSAPIQRASRFLARVPIDRNGARVGTLIVSGSFHSLNREAGAVETSFSAPALKRCDATGGYSTKA